MADTRITEAEFGPIIQQFVTKRILVIGDFILDVYLKGISSRLCPEAPVPVVDVDEQTLLLGGAANTACNIAALGAQVSFCSVIGGDAFGRNAMDLLQRAGVGTGNILMVEDRKTIVKTRVMAGNHVLIRYDDGDETAIPAWCEEALIEKILYSISTYDAVILSDYNKGVLTPRIVETLTALRNKQSFFIAVDSKRLSFFRSLKPSLVKPNYEEAMRLLDLPPVAHNRAAQLREYGEDLTIKTQAIITALTLDAEGSLIFERSRPVYRTYTQSVVSPNVSGAGDTYISAFTLASIVGASPAIAASLATAAASVAIRKEGTAVCSIKELLVQFDSQEKFIYDISALEAVADAVKQAGKKIVFTNGCFDILHSGHVSYLEKARSAGDVLLVGINTDESIRRLKGTSRPVNTLADRMKVLAALSCVDYIVPFGSEHDDTPVSLLNVIRPHVFVKGGDYTEDTLPEADTVRAHGGEIVFIPLVPDHSTTIIIDRIQEAKAAAQEYTSVLL
ncbi:MAG TPA: D-glycero-beta-D-manno-heptose 1-phosphate adenylyltransferase [Ohtaekwangia sp.]|uniref:D-glycero-beta-D-manno-heptose 1-phosphate adenylyltransferase n=1 Tax=Ohtaekwangia sp. TaxID=2066019 RepID=UPI002F957FDE